MKIFLTALLLSVWPTLAWGAVLTGTVTDVRGGVVEGAYVFVFDNQVGATVTIASPGKGAITPRNGKFTIELNPGFYDVCVLSKGFDASCRKIYIGKKDETLTHNVKLALDRQMMKMRGDRFP